MTTTMNLADVLDLIYDADVIVAGGFISNACRIGNAWHLTVLDLDTSAKVDTLTVPVGGTVAVLDIIR